MPGRKRDPFRNPVSVYNRDDEDDIPVEYQDGYHPAVVKPASPNIELTDTVAEALVELVQQGMMIQDAANYMMIAPTTIRSWLRAGDQDPTSSYGWFAMRIRQAQASFMKEMVGNVRSNAKRDGNVALKTLEKAARGDWGPAANDVNLKGTVVHEHVGVELARIVEERKAKKALNAPDPAMVVDALQAPLEGVIRAEDE